MEEAQQFLPYYDTNLLYNENSNISSINSNNFQQELYIIPPPTSISQPLYNSYTHSPTNTQQPLINSSNALPTNLQFHETFNILNSQSIYSQDLFFSPTLSSINSISNNNSFSNIDNLPNF